MNSNHDMYQNIFSIYKTAFKINWTWKQYTFLELPLLDRIVKFHLLLESFPIHDTV